MGKVWHFMHSLRPRTRTRYNACISKWFKLSSGRSDDTFQTDIKTVLEFLNKIFKQGVGYSALNTARSSLSSFLQIDTLPVGKQALFKKFLRGAHNMRPLPS